MLAFEGASKLRASTTTPLYWIASLPLLLFSVATNAETCLKLNYKRPPSLIVSGRITAHHKLPKDSEARTGDGPWLILDQPLLADHTEAAPEESAIYGFCYKWRKIAILPRGGGKEAEAQITQIKKWNNQHVTIVGELRFLGSLAPSALCISENGSFQLRIRCGVAETSQPNQVSRCMVRRLSQGGLR